MQTEMICKVDIANIPMDFVIPHLFCSPVDLYTGCGPEEKGPENTALCGLVYCLRNNSNSFQLKKKKKAYTKYLLCAGQRASSML